MYEKTGFALILSIALILSSGSAVAHEEMNTHQLAENIVHVFLHAIHPGIVLPAAILALVLYVGRRKHKVD